MMLLYAIVLRASMDCGGKGKDIHVCMCVCVKDGRVLAASEMRKRAGQERGGGEKRGQTSPTDGHMLLRSACVCLWMRGGKERDGCREEEV